MSVRERLEGLLLTRNVTGLAKKRGLAALDQLISVIPDLNESMLSDIEVGTIVSVPKDRAKWLVYAEHGDGTCDIIRMDALKDERMIGWVPGQSTADYARSLDADPRLDEQYDPRDPEEELQKAKNSRLSKGARGSAPRA